MPAALASEASQYRVAEISTHLITNAWVIDEQFGRARVTVDEAKEGGSDRAFDEQLPLGRSLFLSGLYCINYVGWKRRC